MINKLNKYCNENRLKNYFHTLRNQALFDQIDKVIERIGTEDKSISIVYGAGHMKATFKYLSAEYGYKVVDSEFIDVFKV